MIRSEFIFKDIEILDPRFDESGIESVVPHEYYASVFKDKCLWLVEFEENNGAHVVCSVSEVNPTRVTELFDHYEGEDVNHKLVVKKDFPIYVNHFYKGAATGTSDTLQGANHD